MKFRGTILVFTFLLAIALAQRNFGFGAQRFNVGRYNPNPTNNDGRYNPSNDDGQYRASGNDGRYNGDSGQYVPDDSGRYVHVDPGYDHNDPGYKHVDVGGGDYTHQGGPDSRYRPDQSGGDRYRPDQSGGGRYRPDQSGGGRYGPDQTGGGRYRPDQSGGGGRYNPDNSGSGSGQNPTGVRNPFGGSGSEKLISGKCSYDSLKNFKIIRREGELNGDKYHYLYETENCMYGEERGELHNKGTKEEVMKAEGLFHYVGPDGVKYTVTYTADENGFLPQGDHLPTPPPIPAAILRSLEYKKSIGEL